MKNVRPKPDPFDCLPPALRLLRVTVVMVGCLLVTGCASGRKFQADTLPVKYHAPPIENAQTIDLTRFATSTITEDLIGKGDVLEVSISAGLAAEDTATFPVRINDTGRANLPIVGAIELDTLDLQEAESVIAQTCIKKGLYSAPHVTVTMKRPKVHRITVLGAVEKPATYELRAGQSDVLQAIVAAGGITEDAGTYVQVRHPGYTQPAAGDQPDLIASMPELEGELATVNGVETADSNVQNAAAENASQPLPVQTGGSKAVRINLASAVVENPQSLELDDGGIVMVEKRDPKPIHVIGLVRRPDRYEFPISEELRMLDAIALAAGTDNPFADKVYIIRQNPAGGEPILIEGSIRKAKRNGRADLALAPGDVVSLEQTPATSAWEALRLVGFGVSGRAF